MITKAVTNHQEDMRYYYRRITLHCPCFVFFYHAAGLTTRASGGK